MSKKEQGNLGQFESRFGAFLDGHRAFAFWKGRTALFAILKGLGVGEGDEVVIPGFTCVVVPNAVRSLGAKPVYADLGKSSYNLDPEQVASLIHPNTKALVVQHTFGIPAEMDSFTRIGRETGVPVIEDCAHTMAVELVDQKAGTFGKASFFSTQWSKPFTTGLGGIAVTSDPELAARIEEIQRDFQLPPILTRWKLNLQYQIYRHFFSSRTYWTAHRLLHSAGRVGLFVRSSADEELAGKIPQDLNWTMPPRQARAGLRGLTGLEENSEHRRRISRFYAKRLGESRWPDPMRFTPNLPLLRYPVLVENKWNLLEQAEREKIEMGSWFESTLHPIRADELRRFGYREGTCPLGEWTAARVVNLPVHPGVCKEDAERISDFFLQNALPVGTVP